MSYDITGSEVSKPDLSCCDDETKSFLEKQHDKWTMQQMNEIIYFDQEKLSKLRAAAEEDVHKSILTQINKNHELKRSFQNQKKRRRNR